MQPFLRPVFVWLALLCLACGNLLPLTAVAANSHGNHGSNGNIGMAICSMSGPQTPQAPLPANHAHCPYCNASQAFDLHLPGAKMAASRLVMLYASATTPPAALMPDNRQHHGWARAPPV